MPKIVDVAAQRRRIADALLRVAVRDGIGAASVRTVGDEAGISAGALRHYFTSQDELLVFALDQLELDVRELVEHSDWGSDNFDNAVQLLGFVLPVDDQRRDTCRLWFEVTMLMRGRPMLQPVWRRTVAATREACATAVRLVAPDLTPSEADRAVTDLHLFVDGLALHGTFVPDVTPAVVESRVRARLASLVQAC